jgi:hypothetical protein
MARTRGKFKRGVIAFRHALKIFPRIDAEAVVGECPAGIE